MYVSIYIYIYIPDEGSLTGVEAARAFDAGGTAAVASTHK